MDNNAKHYQLAAAKIKAAASRPRFMGRFSIRVAKYFGIIMVYSASADYYIQNGISAKSYLLKQAVWVAVGFVITLLVFLMNKKFFEIRKF